MREIVVLVVSLVERMHAHYAAVTAKFGLSPIEGRALYLMEKPVAMSTLAGMLRCDASYITGIMGRFEEQGLVERQVSSVDRRVKNLVLTDRGKDLREAILLHTEQNLPATAGLSAEQQTALRDLLRITQSSLSVVVEANGGPESSQIV